VKSVNNCFCERSAHTTMVLNSLKVFPYLLFLPYTFVVRRSKRI
jgi:hypothetical protein